MSRLVIWGAGELGGRVAAARVAAGDTVVAHTRTETRHPTLREAGADVALGAPDALEPDDTLLIALPGTDRQTMAVVSLRDRPPPRRVVLVSSTGFYGDRRKGVVDEDTPPGDGERAGAVAACETLFRHWAGEAGVVVRSGGLYRVGRGPLSALQKRGSVPPGRPDKTLALIHYDDAAAAVAAALVHPDPQPVYLAVTPPCPSRRDFYLAASVVLGLDLPSFDRDRGGGVRYDVSRLRADLLPEPANPRWQAALVPTCDQPAKPIS